MDYKAREIYCPLSPDGLFQHLLCDIFCAEDLCGSYPTGIWTTISRGYMNGDKNGFAPEGW